MTEDVLTTKAEIIDRLEASVHFEKRCMDFYILVFAILAAALAASVLGNIALQILQQLGHVADPMTTAVVMNTIAGLTAGITAWLLLQRERGYLEKQTASQLSKNLVVREIMLGISGKLDIDFDNLQSESPVEKNRFVELQDGRNIVKWLHTHLQRVEWELPQVRGHGENLTRVFMGAALVGLILILLKRYGIELEFPISLPFLFLLAMAFSSPALIMRPQILRYLLLQEVVWRLRK